MRDSPLRGLARTLLGPLLDGTAPTEPWRLVEWDVDQGVTLTFRDGARELIVELDRRDPGRECFARTARFNVYYHVPRYSEVPADAGELVRAVADALSRREGLLPWPERPTPSRRAEVREIVVDRALVSEGEGAYYLNPYVGCTIGCGFCFAQHLADFSRSLEGAPELPWGRYVDVKINAPEVVAREAARLAPGFVRLSPVVTDPYQPLERRYRITRGCLEALLPAGFTPVVLTRAGRILDDVALLARFPRAYAGFSIPTDDDHVRAIFEPGADPLDARFAALERLRDAGLVTVAAVSPMLPLDVDRLVGRLAPLVRAVRLDALEEPARVAPVYRAYGLERFLSPAYFRDTAAALTEALGRRGVMVHDLQSVRTLPREPLVARS